MMTDKINSVHGLLDIQSSKFQDFGRLKNVLVIGNNKQKIKNLYLIYKPPFVVDKFIFLSEPFKYKSTNLCSGLFVLVVSNQTDILDE